MRAEEAAQRVAPRLKPVEDLASKTDAEAAAEVKDFVEQTTFDKSGDERQSSFTHWHSRRLESQEKEDSGAPTIGQRLKEALDMGVEIQCCTQTMANKNITPGSLIPGVTPAGAMSLIDLASHAKGSLCF